VVLAKLGAYALAAIPFAVVILAVGVLVVEIYAGARGAAPSFTATNLRVLAGSGLALVLYAVIGVGVGALLRNQVGAIVGSLVYLFVVENVIAGIPATASAYKWLPGGALRAIVSSGQPGPSLLDPWQGGLLLLGYGLVAAVIGTLLTVRRDVTCARPSTAPARATRTGSPP
jgi:ABC-2 type transport system permease protein